MLEEAQLCKEQDKYSKVVECTVPVVRKSELKIDGPDRRGCDTNSACSPISKVGKIEYLAVWSVSRLIYWFRDRSQSRILNAVLSIIVHLIAAAAVSKVEDCLRNLR